MANVYETIPGVPRHPGDWKICLTVTEILPAIRRQQRQQICRYVLADPQGNEVLASVRGENVRRLTPLLQQFGVVEIQNAQITLSHQPFPIVARATEWVFSEETMIRKVENVEPHYQTIFANILNMSQLESALDQGTNRVNVMGIIIKCSSKITHPTIYGPLTLQRFTLIDDGHKPRVLTIWNRMVDQFSGRFRTAWLTSYVIVCRHLRISPFAGGSLSATSNTSFILDAAGVEVQEMETWFADVWKCFPYGWVASHKRYLYVIGSWWLCQRVQFCNQAYINATEEQFSGEVSFGALKMIHHTLVGSDFVFGIRLCVCILFWLYEDIGSCFLPN